MRFKNESLLLIFRLFVIIHEPTGVSDESTATNLSRDRWREESANQGQGIRDKGLQTIQIWAGKEVVVFPNQIQFGRIKFSAVRSVLNHLDLMRYYEILLCDTSRYYVGK